MPLQIYKLSDEVPTGKAERKGAGEGKEGGELKITDIKQAVRNENRVNIYVNGKYSFSLDIAQVVELKVKVGRELTETELAEMKQASEFGKIYQRALEWVLVRPRSVKELRDYVARRLKASSSDTLPRRLGDEVVRRLVDKGHVDDAKFAQYFVENRFVKKGISERRLRLELQQKGVSREIIDEVLSGSERSEEDEIRKIIARKRARYTDEKLIQYLCRQGFRYELSRELVSEMDSQSLE